MLSIAIYQPLLDTNHSAYQRILTAYLYVFGIKWSQENLVKRKSQNTDIILLPFLVTSHSHSKCFYIKVFLSVLSGKIPNRPFEGGFSVHQTGLFPGAFLA